MSVLINGGAGVTFPDGVQQTNGVTNTGGSPPYYGARAWVNINGSGSAVIRAQANIATATRTATGRYTFTFTTPMPDANYAVVLTAGDPATGNYLVARIAGAPTASSFSVWTLFQSSGNPVNTDVDYLFAAVFR